MKIIQIPRACVAVTLAGLLAACQQSAAPEAQETAAATAAPEAKPGVSVIDGKLVLPVVTGRPGAVYFKLRNDGDKAASIVSAHVQGATSAEIHETKGGTMAAVKKVDVGANQSVEFAPGGLHIMVFELPADFQSGGTTELTLSFADGDKISVPLAITTVAGQSTTGTAPTDHADHDGMEH